MFTPKGGSEGLLPGHGGECPVSGLMPMSWSDPKRTYNIKGRRGIVPQPKLSGKSYAFN